MRRAKVVLVGPTAAGKTSIVNRFIYDDFAVHTTSTTQPAFAQRVLNDKSRPVSLEIWDTAGQERYHSLSPLFYRDAEAGIVVFDITDTDSFTKASKWISELKTERADDILIIVVGNKTDLESLRTVHRREDEQLAAYRILKQVLKQMTILRQSFLIFAKVLFNQYRKHQINRENHCKQQ
jgi:small GTP-binding protein